MSYKRLKQNFRKSASKLHKTVGEVLRSHPLTKNFRIYQEQPVPNSRYYIDWFIQDLGIAIEVAGQQHEKPIAFNGDKELAKVNFIKQVDRDQDKHQLIKQAGWKLVELWWDEVEEQTIIRRIMEAVLEHK